MKALFGSPLKGASLTSTVCPSITMLFCQEPNHHLQNPSLHSVLERSFQLEYLRIKKDRVIQAHSRKGST